MAQIKRPYEEINIPFAKMSYTPDVPSSALGANEYNIGNNIETDTRGYAVYLATLRSYLRRQELLYM